MKRIALSVMVILILMANVSMASGRNANGEESKKCYNQPEKMEYAGKNAGEYWDSPDNSHALGFLIDKNNLCPPVTQYPELSDTQIPEFPTIALPVAAVLGLLFLFQRGR